MCKKKEKEKQIILEKMFTQLWKKLKRLSLMFPPRFAILLIKKTVLIVYSLTLCFFPYHVLMISYRTVLIENSLFLFRARQEMEILTA